MDPLGVPDASPCSCVDVPELADEGALLAFFQAAMATTPPASISKRLVHDLQVYRPETRDTCALLSACPAAVLSFPPGLFLSAWHMPARWCSCDMTYRY
jgi:hypothetical protein